MTSVFNTLKHWMHQGLGTPIALVVLLSMMILPLPPFALDLLFTFNIAFGLTVILATVYCQRPLDFAVFPTVILLSTLLRLALNIASTRVVLLYGHTGTDAAGQVIQSFGQVVIGGNYTVGLVIFAILVVINFVVVTKGAGRVSEVSARFTLDSLPGKQMAIDADLNAGIISQDEAKLRREEVTQESDFYGSMDGASKFVRGDAIAGIVILFINIIGGLIIGMTQHDMSFGDAAKNYVLLTIGDGLVAQIPSIILSVAAAIIVTRVSKSDDMGSALFYQVFGDIRSLIISGLVVCSLGLIPGMPHLSFIGVSSVMFIAAYLQMLKKNTSLAASSPGGGTVSAGDESANTDNTSVSTPSRELSWDDIQTVDMVSLEIGYRLIPLVDTTQEGVLLGRIRGVRKKLSQELGFLLPSVHIRDNLELNPPCYRISLGGVVMGEAEIHSDKLLAINPGQVFGKADGIKTTDPAFGLEAYWIQESEKEKVQSLGYTVVDPSTVIATHLSKILQAYSAQLLGYEETQLLLDKLAKTYPKLVRELVPDLLPLGTINKILQSLLTESVPISDIRLIVETLVQASSKTKDPQELLAAVRLALANYIVQQIVTVEEELPIITLQPELEKILLDSVDNSANAGNIEPNLAENLQQSVRTVFQQQQNVGQAIVIVVQPPIRSLLARFVRSISSSIHVLSYHEIPDSKQVRIVGTLG